MYGGAGGVGVGEAVEREGWRGGDRADPGCDDGGAGAGECAGGGVDGGRVE